MWRLLAVSSCLAAAGASPCGYQDTLELGQWRPGLRHLDAVIVERPSDHEAAFTYENTFKGFRIRYVSVHNVAVKTCGALAVVAGGGVGSQGLVIRLQAPPYHEIRSVIDVWGDFDVSYSKRKNATR
ncbi:hypothetical protein JYU34_000141 [Plutella xylostella]|uniref:Uncharacterized protein n=1 Tax=Plutella xylostella TaxID=51655 RepID=A0ABQ7PP08_PLUXY|nr:hypothetical protein JYU34_022931 [Plutella xylostella]KAG7313060.1 hypothetical protein JYU34_000141 [Plutella xylostella]